MKKKLILLVLVSVLMLGSIVACTGEQQEPQQQLSEISQASMEWSEQDIELLVDFMNSLYRDAESPFPPIPEYEWYTFVWFDYHSYQMETLTARGIDYDKEEPYCSLWEAWFNADQGIQYANSFPAFWGAHEALLTALKQMDEAIEAGS